MTRRLADRAGDMWGWPSRSPHDRPESWGDGSVGKGPAKLVGRQEFGFSNTHIKAGCRVHTCNPRAGRWRQEDPGDLLASQSSQVSELQVQQETLT